MRSVTLPALLALLCVAAPAWAVGNLADVNIIDRDTGQQLQAHYHKGEYWIAGRPGGRYAIQIRNQMGQRLMAVTSVDGVNVISGETAAVNQTGYVFHAWQRYDIAGWRKSNAEIAAFNFTSIPNSYAARTGRPQNVGVIGVALFRERYTPPPPAPPVGLIAPAAPGAAQERSDSVEMSEVPVTGTRAQPSAEAAAGVDPGGRVSPRGGGPGGGPVGAGAARAGGSGNAEQSRSSPSLGTGHGRREASAVVNVSFERAQETPDELIRIRYDSHDNLVAMGVIPPAPQPRPLDPFPRTPERRYAPDP